MPDLPTLTVTQPQADRLIAAFGSVANYRAWLRQALIDYVIIYERQRLRAQLEADVASSDQQVQSELGTM